MPVSACVCALEAACDFCIEHRPCVDVHASMLLYLRIYACMYACAFSMKFRTFELVYHAHTPYVCMHACICVWKPFRTCVYTYTDVYAHVIAPDISLHMGSLSCKQKIIQMDRCAYTWISMYVTCIYVCMCVYICMQ